MNNYKKLKVWQKSMDLVEQVYQQTKRFPKEETYGLTSQIRRSVISISSNIAEGAGRSSKKEFKYFLSIANGSAYELNTQLLLAVRVGYLSESELNETFIILNEVEKMCYTLIQKISKSVNSR